MPRSPSSSSTHPPRRVIGQTATPIHHVELIDQTMLPALPISTTFDEPSFHPLPIFAPPRQAAGTAAVKADPIHPVKVIGEAMSLILVVPVPPRRPPDVSLARRPPDVSLARRPPDVSLEIVSSLGPPAVAHTPVSYASSADRLIWHHWAVLVVPRASQLLREDRA